MMCWRPWFLVRHACLELHRLMPAGRPCQVGQACLVLRLIFSPIFFSFEATTQLFIFKGGAETLENEIDKILGSKLEDQFSDHFSSLVQNICSVCFSYLLRLSIFCKAPRDMRKFPQK